MQNPKMIVLGLLSIGLRYGFEMEKFAQETQMRRWAEIGASTIYKTLKDLERDGAINAKREKGGPGPARLAYSLTASGRRAFRALVIEAMASDASVYSDRIAGLVFLPAAPHEEALKAIERCDAGLQAADEILAAHQERLKGDAVADAVTGFYRDVYRAERAALAKVKNALAG
ncbi:MAG TPA: PadR family transcriptional regulator [Parvularculaceae bacterium]|nr:PadR family transcriptional regulator [Parvularculaceae bacterium]